MAENKDATKPKTRTDRDSTAPRKPKTAISPKEELGIIHRLRRSIAQANEKLKTARENVVDAKAAVKSKQDELDAVLDNPGQGLLFKPE